jgi:hypothetical protein
LIKKSVGVKPEAMGCTGIRASIHIGTVGAEEMGPIPINPHFQAFTKPKTRGEISFKFFSFRSRYPPRYSLTGGKKNKMRAAVPKNEIPETMGEHYVV